MSITGKIGYATAKGIAAFAAPITALSSTAGRGDYGFLNNLAAVYQVPQKVYQVAANEGIGFTVSSLGDLASLVSNSAKNIAERPWETAAVAGAVFCLTKFSPHIVKAALKKKK